MRTIVVIVVTVLMSAPTDAFAQDRFRGAELSQFEQGLNERSPMPVRDSLTVVARGVRLVESRTLASQQSQAPRRRRGLRRPVLLGTTFGAIGGGAVAMGMDACGDASYQGMCGLALAAGAGVGAGLGALVGLGVGLIRR